MGTSFALAPQPKSLEDPLAHLPCSTILEYRKAQTVYSQDQPSTSIYLVIDGKVKVCRLAGGGRQVVVDIYPWRSPGLRQLAHQFESVLKNLGGLPRFKPPRDAIRSQLQVLDRTRPIFRNGVTVTLWEAGM